MKAVDSYWGKARPDGEVNWHPLAYHSLDVAACAAELVHITPAFEDIDETDVSWIAALHDIGKFARGFQEQAPELHNSLQPNAPSGTFIYGGDYHHSHAGFALWKKFRVARGWPRGLDWLMSASCGHHGQPPRVDAAFQNLDRCYSECDIAATEEFVDGICSLFVIPEPPISDQRGIMSFRLAAIVNIADWIGSNQEWFPYQEASLNLADYWQVAGQKAKHAIASAGLVPAQPTQADFTTLFPDYEPTPTQQLADTFEITGQSLVIIEDTTGSGKTEAADVLASRMLGETAHRIIFALPTTATADGLAERHAAYYRRFYGSEGSTLHLAHSRASRHASNPSLDEAETDVAAWSAGDPRLRLSADLAVGTVDQVCLAAMPARFNSARLFSLMGSVLVIDEVHAFDTYTGHLLRTALRMHAALGGSAVLLSATIPTQQKQQLVESFSEGAGFEGELSPEDFYPLTTVVDGHGSRQIPSTSLSHRTISLKQVHSEDDVIDGLIEASNEGCCVWMRTTVADAIRGFEMLSSRHDNVTLLHSRFPEGWRSEQQQAVLAQYGKNGQASGRKGSIVVATQVIQESLDVDFDFAVIDLRPIDALLQAVGRYRRHSRDKSGELSAIEDRPPGDVWVLMPKIVDVPSETWLSDLLPGTGYVYRDIGQLWRTANAIDGYRQIETPTMLRQLIADVYDVDDCPEALLKATMRAEKDMRRALGAATTLSLDPRAGYMAGSAGYASDERIATRWGVSTEVCLLTKSGENVRPLLDTFQDSCVRIPATSISGATSEALEAVSNWPAMRFLVPIIVEEQTDKTWIGLATRWGKPVTVSVSRSLGIQIL